MRRSPARACRRCITGTVRRRLARFADILTVSNFSGKGPAPSRQLRRPGPVRHVRHGGQREGMVLDRNEPRPISRGRRVERTEDMFADYDARGPFERAPEYGFRVAKYIRPLPPALAAPVRFEALVRDARKEQPVGDDIFEVYRRQYAYDSRTAERRRSRRPKRRRSGVRHTVVIDAAYGGERMRVHLFLPKHGSPPYQTVVFFPPGDAFHLPSSRDLSLRWGDFILRSGRAFLYPVYKGTYERATSDDRYGPNADRELRIAWSRDLGRAIDYL